MLKELFGFIWPVGNWEVVWVRGWNRAVLENRNTLKRKEVTYRLGVKEHVK